MQKYIEHLLENDKDVLEELNQIESPDEAQLAVLLLMMNNIVFMRDNLTIIKKDVAGIKGWITFFGIVAIIGFVLTLII